MQKILTISNAKHFGLSAGNMSIGRFPGGEVSLRIKEDLGGKKVIVVGSTNAPAENLLELTIAIDTAKRLGASKVTAIVPYFAYARADREKFAGDAVSAQTVARMLESVGGENFEVITIDVHSHRMQGFFKNTFRSVDPSGLFIDKFQNIDGLTLVAPDKGAELKAIEFAKKLGIATLATLQKERDDEGNVVVNGIAGETGEKVLMFDDIVDSGGTILKGAQFLKDHGASEIYVAATHMVWQGEGYRRLAETELIKKIFTTDTIMPPVELPGKLEVIPISPILQKIIDGET